MEVCAFSVADYAAFASTFRTQYRSLQKLRHEVRQGGQWESPEGRPMGSLAPGACQPDLDAPRRHLGVFFLALEVRARSSGCRLGRRTPALRASSPRCGSCQGPGVRPGPELSADARLVQVVRAAVARADYRGDAFPLLKRQQPEWTRDRWDQAAAELDGHQRLGI